MNGDWFNTLKWEPSKAFKDKNPGVLDWKEYKKYMDLVLDENYDKGYSTASDRQKFKDIEMKTIGENFEELVKENSELFNKCCRNTKLRHLRRIRHNTSTRLLQGNTIGPVRSDHRKIETNTRIREKIMNMDCEDYYNTLLVGADLDIKLGSGIFNLNFSKLMKLNRSQAPRFSESTKIRPPSNPGFHRSISINSLIYWVKCMNREFGLTLQLTDPDLKQPFSVNTGAAA